MEKSLEIAQILYNKYLDKFHQPITARCGKPTPLGVGWIAL